MQASASVTIGALRAEGWRLDKICRDTTSMSKTARALERVAALRDFVREVIVLETTTLAFVWRRG